MSFRLDKNSMKYKQGILEKAEEWFSNGKGKIRHAAEKHTSTRMLFRAFSFVGMVIHKTIIAVVNTATLTIVYFIGVGITCLIVKILKKDLGFQKGERSSWKPFESKEDIKSYLRQF